VPRECTQTLLNRCNTMYIHRYKTFDTLDVKLSHRKHRYVVSNHFKMLFIPLIFFACHKRRGSNVKKTFFRLTSLEKKPILKSLSVDLFHRCCHDENGV
jgi:hypothetical protein